jgi:hypothetical protein
MWAGIIKFKALSGGHNGKNFGRYTIGLLHRVGNMNKKWSTACAASAQRQF